MPPYTYYKVEKNTNKATIIGCSSREAKEEYNVMNKRKYYITEKCLITGNVRKIKF